MSNFGQGLSSLIPNGSKQPPVPAKHILPEHQSDEGDVLRVLQISPGRIDDNPRQPRTIVDMEKLEDLKNSIVAHGIIEPILVAQKDNGQFELIAGGRRLRAARELGLATVPVMVRHEEDLERLELSLIENLQRQDLNPIEEAEGYHELMEGFGLTQDQVAKKVGRSRETVSNLIRLLELPSEFQKAIASGKLSGAQAKILLSVDNPREREIIFNKTIAQGLTARQTEALATPRMRHRGTTLKNPEVLADENRLRETLNTKVQIEKRGQHGRIIVHFYSPEDYNEIIGKLATEDPQ